MYDDGDLMIMEFDHKGRLLGSSSQARGDSIRNIN